MRETEGESTRLTAQVTPSLDEIFDLLSNRRRRYALYYLHDQPDGVATIDELADAVVTRQYVESSTEGSSASDEQLEFDSDADTDSRLEQRRQQVLMELQHTHLPKLEDAGVLEHDQRSEMIRYWNQPSLEEWLEHAEHKERV